MFVDTAKFLVESGSGGNGAVSFHREKYVAAGGPDGGDGGNGGNIVFVADSSLATLMDLKYRKKYKAADGENGKAANCRGKNAEDTLIRVPCGTIIKDVKHGKIIADLTEDGQRFIAARGGNGGFGNKRFATPTRQTPKFAKAGMKGVQREVQLELKLIADVGLLGFPNVGKSTLISSVSKAAPKIANYHFTTLQPNLGVVKLDDERSFVMADIPGIIEGASEGVGLGHDFLRHVERTRLLIHVVDASGVEGRDALEDFETINAELGRYSTVLAEKKQIIAANKIDLGMNLEQKDAFVQEMKQRGYQVFEISAATGQGVRELMEVAYRLLQTIPKEEIHQVEEIEEEVQEGPQFTVSRQDGVFLVEGEYIERLVMSTNFDDHESFGYFQNMLRKIGVIDELERQGVQEGDMVQLYEIEFEYMR